MKKLLLILSLAFIAINLSAQKLQYVGFELPYYETPQKQDYANYKSYGLYVFSAGKEKLVDGFYTLKNTKLIEEQGNGDFKITVAVKEVKNPKITIKLDSAIVTAESVVAYIYAYDKSGKEFYSKHYQTSTPKGFLLGNYKGKTEEIKKSLHQEMMKNIVASFTSDFIDNYVVSEKKVSGSQLPLIASFYTVFKKSPETLEINDSINALKAVSPEELLPRAQGQLAFWEKWATLPQDKENSDYITCGYYNLAFLHLLLGNTAESEKYATLSKAPKYAMTKLSSFKGYESKYSLTYPVLEGPFVHGSEVVSTFSILDAIDSFVYYMIPNSVVELNDGTKYTGKCKIEKVDKNQSVGNVINLDAANYDIVIEQTSGNDTTQLSKIKQISSGDDVYVHVKRVLYKNIVTSPSLTLYSQVFPAGEQGYYFRKANEEMETPPLLGVGKWYKKYFADCVELTNKIDKKELVKPVDIAEYYINNCK